jgi:nitrogen-specific signal transduction histidine kinase
MIDYFAQHALIYRQNDRVTGLLDRLEAFNGLGTEARDVILEGLL